MTARLRFLAGARAGELLAIADGEERVAGRDPAAGIVLEGPNVSRRHARFAWQGGRLVVENLSRVNALWVNGVRQARAELRRWDIMVVGPHVIRIDAVPGETEPGRGGTEPLLAALLELQRLIAAGGADLVPRSLQVLLDALPASRLALFAPGPDGEPVQGPTATRRPGAATAMSIGLARQVLGAGRPVLIETAGAASITASLSAVCTAIGAPLTAADGSIAGALLADNLEEPRLLTHAHLGALEIAAQALAAAADRARGLDAERQRLRVEAEFEAARAVQRHVARADAADLAPAWRWAVRLQPALELAGDWLDAADVPGGTLWVVADVSGKGLPAALVTGMLKIAFRAAIAGADGPGAVLAAMHRLVAGQLPATMFFTAAALLAGPGRRVRWASVGHPALLIVDPGGAVRRLAYGSGTLGSGFIHPSPEALVEHAAVLAPGERIAILTDGVTEAAAPGGGMLGDAGVDRVLAGAGPGSAAVADVLLAAALAGGPPGDDITVVVGDPL